MASTSPPSPALRRSSRKKRKQEHTASNDVVTKLTIREPSKRKTRPKAGRLSDLPNQHLDILFEIFGYLHPHDLLKLSRTTKDFRRLLLSISSRPIWKASLKNVPGLPDCPPDINEPQWANLAFSPHCHLCLGVARNVEWCFHVRMCSKCAKRHLENAFLYVEVPFDVKDIKLGRSPTMQQFIYLIPRKNIRYNLYHYFDRDLNEVTSKYNSLETEEERITFLKAREIFIEQRLTHAKECELWHSAQATSRSQELDNIRSERKEAILKKLKELGYEEDYLSIQHPDSFDDHKLVKNPHPLTERVWNNIKPQMIEFMEEMRAKRIKRERISIITKRKAAALKELVIFKHAHLPFTNIMPEGPDFYDFPPIKALIEQPNDDEPDFSVVSNLLPDLIIVWREEVQELFISHLLDRSPGNFSTLPTSKTRIANKKSVVKEEEIEPLASLATTVFTCNCCRSVLFYPEILGHRCWTTIRCNGFTSFYLRHLSITRKKKWDCSGDGYDLSWRVSDSAAIYVVKLAGMDPKTASVKEMDSLTDRFVCHECDDFYRTVHRDDDNDDDAPKRILNALAWRGAVDHLLRHHASHCYNMKKVNRDDLTGYNNVVGVLDISEIKAWICTHCRGDDTIRRTLELTKIHLLQQHAIAGFDRELNKDYYLDYEAPNLHLTEWNDVYEDLSDVSSLDSFWF